MGCPQNNKPESYSFFKNIMVYLDAVKGSENNETPQEVTKECTSMSSNHYKNKNPKIAKSICEQFLKLYKLLNNSVSKPKGDPTYVSVVNFLNYWLNTELKKKMYNENICVKDFCDNLETYSYGIVDIKMHSNDEIYVIKNDDLENMNILYNLYSNYYNVYNGSNIVCTAKDTCLEYSKKCFEEYKKGIIKCEKSESDFCKAIRVFESEYKSLKQQNKSNDDFNSKDLITLPSYEEAFNEYLSELKRRNITIATISIICSIFGIILILFSLYKFTPFGKWLPINKKDQEKRHVMKEKIYNFIDNSNEYSTYNKYTPYRFGYNST
ncbi:PIR protein [Plasmodium vivax]|uniref:VIR protein n=1 Tax=Plasmodium vivax TaxID=5855 RepID=A0A565A3X9_PLAVI|nr:PIR protein [Plasmodium vivax]